MPVAERVNLLYVPLTMAVGQSLSQDIAPLQGYLLVGIVIPTNFDGTALTFQVGLTVDDLYNFYASDGTEKSFTVAASRHVLVVPEDFAGVPYLKIRAGTNGSPTVQVGTATTVTLVLRPI